MRRRRVVAGVVIAAAAILFVSDLRWEVAPDDPFSAISPPICGPLTDQNGNPAGDAGPCPSLDPPRQQLTWAPFWVAPD